MLVIANKDFDHFWPSLCSLLLTTNNYEANYLLIPILVAIWAMSILQGLFLGFQLVKIKSQKLRRDGLTMRPSIWVGPVHACNNILIFLAFINFDLNIDQNWKMPTKWKKYSGCHTRELGQPKLTVSLYVRLVQDQLK